MASEGSAIQTPRICQNYLAILVAAIACFLLAAAWYSYFMQPWLDGIGRTREWLLATGVSPALQYATSLLAAFLIAMVISGITQYTGPQTAFRGVKVAGVLWMGLVLTTWATEYAFEVRPFSLFAINAGFWLLGMCLMGAIVGVWRKR
ncbi:MAG TPA: DUF1761 domain-containing protein [Terracidiphilus sp.]|nr:DUF1761 domain-containing protein [Terracidiphilus sp.]